MDASIQPVDVAEQGREAARTAVNTFEQQTNPHAVDTPEHAMWHAAYCRYLLLFNAPDAETSA